MMEMKHIILLLLALVTFDVAHAAPKYIAVTENDTSISNFALMKGLLPLPCSGSAIVIKHFGDDRIEGSQDSVTTSKGVVLKIESGNDVEAIYNGIVSSVFSFKGKAGVIIRHGEYLSVYLGMAKICVSKGETVKTHQQIGTLRKDKTLDFQVRHNTEPLNPEEWLKPIINSVYSNQKVS